MWELDCEEGWVPKNWCFWTVVLEKTLESPLDCKGIQPVHPNDQSWVFIGGPDVETETPVLWPPDAKNWLFWKDPIAGKDWRQEEKGTAEDEVVGRHHWLNGYEFEQTPGDREGQGSLVWCSPCGHRVRNNLATEKQHTIPYTSLQHLPNRRLFFLLDCKLHKGRNHVLCSSWEPFCLAQCLAHGRHWSIVL